jgi:energy-coupling factor transporter ATP-binding protein EcfA2
VSAISWRAVRFAHGEDHDRLALDDVDLDVVEGEVLVVTGGSGSGKSTLLRCANGLVPHASGGRFGGEVVTFGRSTRTHRPRELAEVVGFVAQDPEAQHVVDEVQRDVAFALENLGFPVEAMHRRVEETLDALGIAHLRDRDPSTLSGGERQRCVIAGALAAGPAALVLDEPTSQLDPQGADDVLAAVSRLNADLGTTVVLAEHRLERAAPMADRVAVMAAGRLGALGSPGAVLADYPGAPTVVHLGRALGWDPLPLTVREARAQASTHPLAALPPSSVAPAIRGSALVTARDLHVELGGRTVLRDITTAVHEGDVIALLGRNGAGKTTLLRALAGLQPAGRGRVERVGAVGYVPQDPGTMLFAPTVRAELAETLRLLGRNDPETVAHWLDALGLGPVAERHPRGLSGGERQRVAVAAVAVGGAPVLALDEPTRGMDAGSRAALEAAVLDHAAGGGAVVLATHDVELAARVATRTVVLGNGEIVADGPAREVLAGSLFAPQVLRVVPPFLTVAEVSAALERS